MELDYKMIGVRVKGIRKSRGLTQEKLAENAKLSTVYIGYVENAKKKISLSSLASIANALNVGIDDLINNQVYHSEYKELLLNCTEIQKEIILATIKAVKDVLTERNL